MKTCRRTLGVAVILSVFFFGLPAFCDGQAMRDTETMYTSIIDKEIAKYQAKTELKNSGSANLQQEAVEAGIMSAFLKNYKEELVAAMKRNNIGTEDYQINNFLNEEFLEVSSSAWLQYCCAPGDKEASLEVSSSVWLQFCCGPRDPE